MNEYVNSMIENIPPETLLFSRCISITFGIIIIITGLIIMAKKKDKKSTPAWICIGIGAAATIVNTVLLISSYL